MTQAVCARSGFAAAISSSWRESVEHIIGTGRLLLEAKRALPHGEFGLMFARGEVPFKQRTAQMLMAISASPVLTNSKHASHLPPSWVTLHELAKLPNETLTRYLTDGTVNAETQRQDVYHLLGKHSLDVHFSSSSPEWNTPPDIVQRVESTMGSIDLDPCSNESSPVPATTRYTKHRDGLSEDWAGRVFLNPPYGREIGRWVAKLVAEYESGRVTQAIALVPARVDTTWFRMFRDFALCFVDGRLKFSGHDNSAPFPSVLVYFGTDITAFHDKFVDVGTIWVRWRK